jgi:glutaredoxin
MIFCRQFLKTMSKTTILLLLAFAALFQNQAKIKNWLNPMPPLAAGSYKVVLYSTTWCGYCAKTRTYFAENHIEYQDIDVEKTEAGQKAYQELGANGVPIVVVNDDKIIRGYAPGDFVEALTVKTPN